MIILASTNALVSQISVTKETIWDMEELVGLGYMDPERN
jgi:hypothetical protein